MIKNKIIYSVLMVYTAIFAILYNEYSMALVFLMICSIPFLLLLILLRLRACVDVAINPDLLVVAKDGFMGISVAVTNRSLFPIGHMRINLVAKNEFSKQKSKSSITCFIDGKSQQILRCNLSSNHCGNIEIKCPNIRIYDYFRIFSLKKAVKQTIHVTILPEMYEIESQIVISPSQTTMESEVFSKAKSGDDPSEVFAIREYRQGDKIHRIHWKLSSKKDQYMVKEYSLPINCSVSILVEAYYRGDTKEELDFIDGLLESALSLSYALMCSECSHYISWYDSEKDEFRQEKVSNEDDIYLVMEQLLHLKLYTQNGKAIELQQAFCSQEQVTHIYYIGTEVSIEQGETLRHAYQGANLHMIHIHSSALREKKLPNPEQFEGLLIQATNLELSNLKAALGVFEL